MLISDPETLNLDMAAFVLRNKEESALEKVGQVNTHSYAGYNRRALGSFTDSIHRKLWVSEYGLGPLDHDHGSMEPALGFAKTL